MHIAITVFEPTLQTGKPCIGIIIMNYNIVKNFVIFVVIFLVLFNISNVSILLLSYSHMFQGQMSDFILFSTHSIVSIIFFHFFLSFCCCIFNKIDISLDCINEFHAFLMWLCLVFALCTWTGLVCVIDQRMLVVGYLIHIFGRKTFRWKEMSFFSIPCVFAWCSSTILRSTLMCHFFRVCWVELGTLCPTC